MTIETERNGKGVSEITNNPQDLDPEAAAARARMEARRERNAPQGGLLGRVGARSSREMPQSQPAQESQETQDDVRNGIIEAAKALSRADSDPKNSSLQTRAFFEAQDMVFGLDLAGRPSTSEEEDKDLADAVKKLDSKSIEWTKQEDKDAMIAGKPQLKGGQVTGLRSLGRSISNAEPSPVPGDK